MRLLTSGSSQGGRSLWSRAGWKWETEASKARTKAWLGTGRDIRKLDKEEEEVNEDSDFSDASWKSAHAWKGCMLGCQVD